MRADNSHHLVAAARKRRAATLERARDALRRLEASGERVTFPSVAAAAGVSRSWLYAEADIRAEIDRLRAQQHAAPSRPVPVRQRASEASLLRRLELAHERARALEAENRQLRQQLARAHGDLRAARRQGASR